MRRTTLAAIVVAASTTVGAQAPAPGWIQVNGGWVPPTHPLAKIPAPKSVVSGPTAFEAGNMYQGPYPSQRFLVLGTTRSTSGRTVVTYEWATDGWGTPRGALGVAFADQLLGFALIEQE